MTNPAFRTDPIPFVNDYLLPQYARAQAGRDTMMTYEADVDEVPTDDEVMAIVGATEDGIDAASLVDQLVAGAHTRRNSQRAVQRALDRGKIDLGRGLRLVIAHHHAVAA